MGKEKKGRENSKKDRGKDRKEDKVGVEREKTKRNRIGRWGEVRRGGRKLGARRIRQRRRERLIEKKSEACEIKLERNNERKRKMEMI